MEQFYVFMVNSFWDSANIVLGCLRQSTHLHMLWQCQMIVGAFKDHMNECQSCLKALEQCRLNSILPPWRSGASDLLSFLLRKGKKQQSWNRESEGKSMWEERTGAGKPEKCWQLLLPCPSSHRWQGIPWVSNPLLQAKMPAGPWPFYLSFCLLFPQTAS